MWSPVWVSNAFISINCMNTEQQNRQPNITRTHTWNWNTHVLIDKWALRYGKKGRKKHTHTKPATQLRRRTEWETIGDCDTVAHFQAHRDRSIERTRQEHIHNFGMYVCNVCNACTTINLLMPMFRPAFYFPVFFVHSIDGFFVLCVFSSFSLLS